MIAAQLEQFKENLATKPYCTDAKEFGLLIRPKNTALKKKYIQHNKPSSVKYLAFDCDYAGADQLIGDEHLPPPNFIAFNQVNGRSHVFYALEVEVYTVENARRKPIELLAAIEHRLCTVLKADPAYTGFIVKNPCHSDWEVHEYKTTPWGLNEFLEYIELPAKTPKKARDFGLGRNVFLFDSTRYWAYAQVLSYRLSGARDEFFEAVLNYAVEKNSQFPVPLSFPEVKATAKSIAKWTWNKYTGRMTDQQFSAKQAARGTRSGQARVQKNLESRVMANLFSMVGLKQSQIVKILSAPKQSVSRWLVE